MKYLLFFLCLFANLFINAQLIPNSGFEIDNIAPLGKPDFYRYRIDAIQGIELDTVRSGSYAALFNNTGPDIQDGYFYSHYNAEGNAANFLNVATGETYEFSFYYRTASGFIGQGVGAQILFANEQGHFIGNVAIEPYRISTGQWTKMSISGTIPSGVTKLCTGIYYKGKGKAWIDDAELIRTGRPIAPNLSFETDVVAPLDKPDNYLARFQEYHHRETDYNFTYLGNGAAKFNNTTNDNIACYYYGNYDASGTVREGIPVHPNDRYRFTGYTRTSMDFLGIGMSLSAIFFDKNGQYVSRYDSPDIIAPTWEKIDFEIQVPDGASHMIPSTEYIGSGEAWFDQIDIKMTNPLINSGFETDTAAPISQPDHWKSRYGATDLIAGIETNPNLVYSGKQCAKFESYTEDISYYYGPYADDGSERQIFTVIPGQEFELIAQAKTSPDFVGEGLRIAIIFWDGDDFHSRVNTTWVKHDNWSEEKIAAVVPQGANSISVSIEFFGKGIGWFDNIELNDLQTIWYLQDAPIDEFESLGFPGGDKVPVDVMIDRFKYHDTIMQDLYNGDGTWGVGYLCQPLIRMSANAALGYLNVYSLIPIERYLTRAYDALDHLVADQQEDGAFIWYGGGLNGIGVCGEGSLSTGAVMYEGGIAGAALIKGYEMSGKQKYLDASNKFCQYLVSRPPSANANFTGFALWALTENYRITSNPDFLETALIYFESMHAFQLDAGLWADIHNQRIHYHGIMIRANVNLLSIMPQDHPKTEVIRHSTYKGINHIIRSQRPGGLVHLYPTGDREVYSIFTLDPMVIAWDKLGYTDLENQINEYTIGAKIISPDAIQGHQFASLGLLFNHYYQNQPNDCPDDFAGLNKLTGVQNSAENFETNGIIESDQHIGPQIDVYYNSGECVNLLPGFIVEQSTVFEVLMNGCENN